MEKVADGVWLLRGDTRKAMNIYFLEDGDGVVQFDAGTKAMVNKARPAGEASVPHPAWAWDHAKAKESVRKLAALEPRVVGTGHNEPLRGGNLRPALERAAEKY